MAERITKTVFVVGGTDYLGSHFVPALLERLDEQSKVFLLTAQPAEVGDSRVVNLVGGLPSIGQFAAELRSSQLVYHLPAEDTLETAAELEASLVVPTKQLIDLLKDSPALSSCVLVSSTRVKEPSSVYDQAITALDKYLFGSKVPFTIFRAGLVYGRFLPARSPLSFLVDKIYRRTWIYRGAFDKKVSLIHVDDLVAGLIACITNTKMVNQVYSAEVEALSLGEITATLYEHMKGEKPTQWPIPAVLLGQWYKELPTATQESNFVDEVLGAAPRRRFEDRAIDCIATYISNVGYWLITGANSGIGYELACRLHARGKNLILVDKDTNNLVGLGKQRIITADLSDRQQVLGVVEKISHYRLYALINNAGVGYKGEYLDNSLEQIERMVAVNMSAPLLLTKALTPTIIKNNGVIVNVASSAAYNPLPGMGVYAATKSFILQWSTALWYELRQKCLVITVSPSGANTCFQANAGVRTTGKLLSPRLVAHQIVTAIAQRRPFIFLGKKNQVVIYLSRLLPARINVSMWANLFKKMR